jgi:ankyrin repeat protein
MQLLQNPISKADSPDENRFGSVLAVASALASQFIKHELNDGLHKNSERDKTQISLFSWAAQCGHVTVVRLLPEAKADVEAKNEDQRTALHRAAENGHEAVVWLLIEANANVEAKDKHRWTSLHWAAMGGQGRGAAVDRG